MKKVLFVDDEKAALDRLAAALAGMQDQWRMEFVGSGEEALESVDREHPDVVVSDMTMAGMDGAHLLAEVKRRHPESLRIILADETDKQQTLASLGSTHECLAKPCDPEMLKTAIRRAESNRDLLDSDTLKGLIDELDSLPTLPSLFHDVVRELQDPQGSLKRVAEIIGQDIGMTSKLMQIVNSAFFSLKHPVTNIERAVTVLGMDSIHALVLSVNVFSRYEGLNVPGFDLDALWHRSLQTSGCTRAIAAVAGLDDGTRDDAILGGLLHDCGILVLAANLPDRYREVLVHSRRESIPLSEAEIETLGTSHAEVGAYVMNLWGMPGPVVEAIAFHERPTQAPSCGLTPLTLVHVASVLAGGPTDPVIDEEYARAAGVTELIPAWRDACAPLLGQPVTES